MSKQYLIYFSVSVSLTLQDILSLNKRTRKGVQSIFLIIYYNQFFIIDSLLFILLNKGDS